MMYSRSSRFTRSQSTLLLRVTVMKLLLMNTPVTNGRLKIFSANGDTPTGSCGPRNSNRRPSCTSIRLLTYRIVSGFGVLSAYRLMGGSLVSSDMGEMAISRPWA